mmetsp:Transcript_43077/g.75547  ORF Transcript_43077/g.75547 Transcript_43077/m.75547 type:complete len:1054 (+) Transcript_43077:240-3401(+)|eukprot:CAMPEP_0201870318 /NCGR_PEP_ID=MMETSP0902-20130614/3459_1 /ASSEMBLY_ACC=CAM_ASM_000551 /TAXON_ID=420261 /ORGANISM="Thalassiosira antarctica, Strain CCMP982" /LENGTH=1053 /DNA_ID=CAMNT_0048395909 /DNA_START=140 /DNA_END=3301 /DNA_ORIENTATION=-
MDISDFDPSLLMNYWEHEDDSAHGGTVVAGGGGGDSKSSSSSNNDNGNHPHVNDGSQQQQQPPLSTVATAAAVVAPPQSQAESSSTCAAATTAASSTTMAATTAAGGGGASSTVEPAASYFLNQVHNHPLAMTSMSSCPPYATTTMIMHNDHGSNQQGSHQGNSHQGTTANNSMVMHNDHGNQGNQNHQGGNSNNQGSNNNQGGGGAAQIVVNQGVRVNDAAAPTNVAAAVSVVATTGGGGSPNATNTSNGMTGSTKSGSGPLSYPLLPSAHTNTHPQPQSFLPLNAAGQANANSSMFNFPSIITNTTGSHTNVANAANTNTNGSATSNGNNATNTNNNNNSNATWSTHLSELTSNFLASNKAAAGCPALGAATTSSSSLHGNLHGHVPAPLHFGMTVNGFHPQVNAQVNHVGGAKVHSQAVTNSNTTNSIDVKHVQQQLLANAATASTTSTTASAVPHHRAPANNDTHHHHGANDTATSTAGGSTTHQRTTRDRNVREQNRAKKITQLITELKENMEEGGWKEEMKSKYQTLSQCQEYMEHLQRSHKAKEAEIEHTKKLLEEKNAMTLEAQSEEARSYVGLEYNDPPESVMSGLTDSTARSTSSGGGELNDEESSSTMSSSGDSQDVGGSATNKKRTKSSSVNSTLPPPLLPNKKSRTTKSRGKKRKNKQGVKEQEPSSTAETSSMSEDDDCEDESTPRGKNISFDKTSSCVSDMTDSHRSSTDGNGISKGEGSTSSISSTAAVVRGVGSSQVTESRSRHTTHSRLRLREQEQRNLPAVKEDSNGMNSKKKRRGFHYDYREVFLKSNVPQLIATLSGRIVVWNKFFLTATGLSERDAKRLTIFSIVQSNQLSKLYKMVARALAADEKSSNSSSSSGGGPSSSPSSNNNSTSGSSTTKSNGVRTTTNTNTDSNEEEWQAITLKCIPFHQSHNKNSNNDPSSKTKKKKQKRATTSSTTATTSTSTHHPHPLYITVALMEDQNRDQRCFHCILTDCPGTNEGKLGSVTPELFSMLFTPSSSAKKKNTVVGAAATMVTTTKTEEEEGHCGDDGMEL